MGRPMRDAEHLRAVVGHGARIWAGSGAHLVRSTGWLGLSGEHDPLYNVACFWGTTGADLTQHLIDPIVVMGRPALIMLAGAGLGTAQTLADRGWRSMGARPLMFLPTISVGHRRDPAVRLLTAGELGVTRHHLAVNYGVPEATARVAVPDRALVEPGLGLWGLFDDNEMKSFVTTSIHDRLVTVWSMVTPSADRGQGYGRRLLASVLRTLAIEGATGSVLRSSAAGQSFYAGLGYEVVEHWQLWSAQRPAR